MHRRGQGTSILVCTGRGDAAEVRSTLAHLTRLTPGAVVQPVRNLCAGSRALAAASRRCVESFVVVFPCRAHPHDRRTIRDLRDVVLAHARQRPTVVVVDPADLAAHSSKDFAKLSAVAVAAATLAGPSAAPISNPGAPPSSGIDRRALLTGRLRARKPLPELKDGRCTLSPWCRLCVDSCPRSALSMHEGVPAADAAGCDGCGTCVTACPVEALRIAAMPSHVWAQYLQHALAAAHELRQPLGISWACADAEPSPTPIQTAASLRLRVPCVQALTPAWLLQPLAAGAAAVSVTPCRSAAARWTPSDPLPQLLTALVGSPDYHGPSGSLTWLAPSMAAPKVELSLREPTATAQAVDQLGLAPDQFLACERSPVGLVSCVAGACTSCGICVERCPTHALGYREREGSWTLTFDHAGCAACGACVTSCPEHALTLHRGVDPMALHTRLELTTTALARCHLCGTALPSAALQARMAAVGVAVPDDGICGDCRAARGARQRAAAGS
jgi:ferredoxin